MRGEAAEVRRGKGKFGPLEGLDFKLTFIDVLTGKTVLDEEFEAPAKRNLIPPKDAEKRVGELVKRLRDDIKKRESGQPNKSKGKVKV